MPLGVVKSITTKLSKESTLAWAFFKKICILGPPFCKDKLIN